MRRFPHLLCAGLAALSIGCGALNNDNSANPAAPSGPPATGSKIVYDAVGASDADGYGSSVPCVPFVDCPNGKGYAQDATRQLTNQGFTVTLTNFGIPTAVIGRDFQTLGQQYGRTIEGNFIDNEMPFVNGATLITIFAGANEVNTITTALGAGAGASDQAGYINQQVTAFGADYATLLAGLRSRASGVRIVVLNVPNLAGLPFLAGDSAAKRQAAQLAAVGMTTRVINPLTSQGINVVDLMCAPWVYQASNYSSDGFHPNDAGYAAIAAELVRAITSTAYPAPQASCGPMTLVH